MSGKLDSVWGDDDPAVRAESFNTNYRLYIDTVITSVKKQLSVLGTRVGSNFKELHTGGSGRCRPVYK